MFPRTNKRKGISTVLTTMIILVASVVLGTGVVIYGTSLFQTGAQQQSISTQGVKMWVNATDTSGLAWGAAGVRNSGDKLISVDQIIVRGASVPFTSWYVDKNQTRVSTDNFQSQYIHTGTQGASNLLRNSGNITAGYTTNCDAGGASTGGAFYIKMDFDGSAGNKKTMCLIQATGPTALNPGERMVVYFKVPAGVISSVDAGASTSVSVFAGQTGAPTSVTVANP
jgi:hypothetical protein